jgi:hypothetical protein
MIPPSVGRRTNTKPTPQGDDCVSRTPLPCPQRERAGPANAGPARSSREGRGNIPLGSRVAVRRVEAADAVAGVTEQAGNAAAQ